MSEDRRTVRGEHGPSAADLLPRLKHDGCNLLVTGSVSEETADRATRRLLGSPDLERKRVLVTADEDAGRPADVLPAGVTVDDPAVEVVEYSAHRDDPEPLVSVGRSVSDAVAAFDSMPGEFVGGELRLAVTSLQSLVEDNGLLALEQFLRRVTAAVIAVRGMGHYRYAGPREELEPLPTDRLFDGFVDLRDCSAAEQRLSVPSAQSTGWLGL